MRNIISEAKLLKLDGKAYRSDLMSGSGKGYARDNSPRRRLGTSEGSLHLQLESFYSFNSMTKDIVGIPAEDLTRNGWSLKMEDDKVKALYESKLRQLKAKERLQ